jgi:adenylate cyclase class 2
MKRATNREVEVKLFVNDLPAAVKKLKALGAVNYGRVFERNTLYDTPDADLRRSGRLLRIRLETPAQSEWSKAGPGKAVVTAKAPPKREMKSRFKERLEREAAISDPEHWEESLLSAGFQPKFVYEKFRTSSQLPQLHLDLDETPAGTFLELEGNPKAIDRVAKTIGYAASDYFRGTYWDVYAADCKKRGVAPKNMVFVRKKIGK